MSIRRPDRTRGYCREEPGDTALRTAPPGLERQDKGPRGAGLGGREFSKGYAAYPRCALSLRDVRFFGFFNDFLGLARCAESLR